jgi:arylformamidase
MGEALWHGYDKEQLDIQYRASSRIPDGPRFFERWAADSQAVRDACSNVLDIRFGSHPAEHFDVFMASAPRAPIHVFIHGGYWQSFSSKEFSFIARGLVPAGITTVVLNYGICPDVTMTELVRQCRAGMAYVHEHARDWGADPDRLSVSGHSAGGHLTAMLCSTDWSRFAPGRPGDMVKAGLAISGLYDLEPVRLSYPNDKLHMDKAEAAALSPSKHLAHARGAMSVAVGGEESDEFHWQQGQFAAAWAKQTGVAPTVVDLAGLHHFSVLDELSMPDGRLAREVRRQLGA